MDNSTLNITAQLFQVTTPTSSTPALSISDDVITVGAAQVQVKGTLGMILNGPLETAQISSHPNSNLNLESASGSVEMVGRGGVNIEDGPHFEGVQITSNEKLLISSRSEVGAGVERERERERERLYYSTCTFTPFRLYWILGQCD